MANKILNYQKGSTGRGATDTFTIKDRHRTRDGKVSTKAFNVRCGGKNAKSRVCELVESELDRLEQAIDQEELHSDERLHKMEANEHENPREAYEKGALKRRIKRQNAKAKKRGIGDVPHTSKRKNDVPF